MLIFLISFAFRFLILVNSDLIIDDFYITLRAAKNLALGNDLVYNLNEYIYPVTSVLYAVICAVFFLIFGEGASFGLRLLGGAADSITSAVVFLIIISLVKSEPIKNYKYLLGVFGALSYSALSSTAIVSIYGMETPLYVLCIAFSFLYYLKEHYNASMLFAALAAIMRPDGILLFAAIFIYCVLITRQIKLKYTTYFFIPYISFLAIVYLYYDTIIPQAIIAKSLGYISFNDELQIFLNKFFISYKSIIPGLFFLTGCYFSIKKKKALLLLIWSMTYAAMFVSFGKWYVWYFPPFIFAYWIILTIGIDGLVEKLKGLKIINIYTLSVLLFVPVILAADTIIREKEQKKFVQPYNKQTDELGNWLNENISDDEKVLLEPLGRVGYVAFNKTFTDYPGIVSREVSNSLSRAGRKVFGSPMDVEAMKCIITDVKPEVLILRETEYRWLNQKGIINKYSLEFISYIDTAKISKSEIEQDMYILRIRN